MSPSSSTPDTGGAAFPCHQQIGPNGEVLLWAEPGMTLRDFFAAHAPAEPHQWFEPTMPHPKPVAPPPIRTETPEEQEEWSAYMEDMILVEQIRSPRLAGLIRESNYYRQQLRDWQADYTKQRLIQWPWAWADAMLKARSA